MTSEPVFLSLDQALRIHARMIELFGGADGVREWRCWSPHSRNPPRHSAGSFC